MENKNNVENQDIKSKAPEQEVNKEKAINNEASKAKKSVAPKREKKAQEAKLVAAQKQIEHLQQKIIDLELEQAKNIADFKSKAQTFASKAQSEIAKHKAEINAQNAKEVANLQKYGSQKLLEAIMEPILNIEIAVQAGKKDPATNAYVIGFEMLLSQFYNELSSFGVTKITPQVNDEFDPNLHYAITTQKGDSASKHKIIEIKKEGFKLHDRVLKPATVVIGE